jgi:bacteriocin-like protein
MYFIFLPMVIINLNEEIEDGNFIKSDFASIFVSQIRTLTDDELKHVSGGDFTEDSSSNPSPIKQDAAGMFR